MIEKLFLIFVYLITGCQLCTGQDIKVGILFDEFASTRWKMDSKFLQEEFAKRDVKTFMQVAHSDFDLQMKQAEQLIDSGVNALVVVSVNANQPQRFMKKAKEKGVLVIAYDRPILDERVDLYVSYDNLEIGRIQGRYIAESVKEGNIIMMNGPVSDVNATYFRKGQLEALDPYIQTGKINVKWDIVLDSWQETTALMAFYENDIDFKQVKGFTSAIDAFVNAAIEYTGNENELKSVYTTGQSPDLGVVYRLKNDVQNMCILKPIQPLAEKTVELILNKVNNKINAGITEFKIGDLVVDAYLFQPVVLDKSNIDEYKNKLDQ